ncbi:MAG: hypothetical protein HZA64_14120 [Rhodocyclales bacterium]|nr:hypothetical protein [Rhodocyclales bacterium]
MAKRFLPDHEFHIGENDEAHIGQFPNLRSMALHVVGKAPAQMPDGSIDPEGMGMYALGQLIGDAHFKLMRPWPTSSTEWFGLLQSGPDNSQIDIIADAMLPLSLRASTVRVVFLYRVGAFLDIALHWPERLPAIIAALDALTNERLTERARAILETGTDPGAGDLWPLDPEKWAPVCNATEVQEVRHV